MRMGIACTALCLAFMAAACGSSEHGTRPTAPSSPAVATPHPTPAFAADFDGVWTGTWKLSTSTVPWADKNAVRSFLLRLRVFGQRLEGYVVLDGAANVVLSGNVAGAVQNDYRLLLAGSAPARGTNDPSVTFAITLWLVGDSLQGAIEYQMLGPPTWDPRGSHDVAAGVVTTAVRRAQLADGFDGTWRGRYLVRACDLVGWPQCYGAAVGETGEVELTLSHSGNLVSGTLWPDYSRSAPEWAMRITVSGQATADNLSVTGSGGPYPSSPGVIRRLTAFSARRDSVGRLSGSLTWQEDFVASGGPHGGGLYRTTRTGDLLLVLQVE